MWKIKGYKGKRSDYRQAFRIKLIRPDQKDRWLLTQFIMAAQDRIDWCEENCTREWYLEFDHDKEYWFASRSDAIMFKLIWGGSQ